MANDPLLPPRRGARSAGGSYGLLFPDQGWAGRCSYGLGDQRPQLPGDLGTPGAAQRADSRGH
eukprot:14122447-Alexandrium_andersonii.AAC.1